VIDDARVIYVTEWSSPTKLVVRNTADHHQLLTIVWNDDRWSIQGDDTPLLLYQGITFTGNPLIDINILSHLPHDILHYVVTTCSYLWGLATQLPCGKGGWMCYTRVSLSLTTLSLNSAVYLALSPANVWACGGSWRKATNQQSSG